ncbi:23S rRNA (adenine1618-N6)-methyltransferase [Mesoflavibacter sabulilitoris]|uniref:23S rRNA (Adenine(1618)-N(6))-methyltransferase RlmF n=1 Tax=Mesoflavibacter zeaxanthinifaciens subsp. sabulilitoris TaxID=1520893 RepID=A0A2T1NFG4_9FLAO|nr:23S rRNA (adenine(1618)-N(6))-methyltransferase RlmF [Mesoflavibacter zeaxanthinifaciens]MBB3124734.1 23S rRNA (adenine1618-N6)-methyltransferase [Mesoflavibacter zeaxanthinifaciens subsp. sabulilitoris]PSG91169.1 23S rRNA (adenine(1618)-N(6))-methyltransferase RlmF [Mesoflavibacter zeaxanthinifaciens subsp. sabulilitoris]
MKSAKGHTNNYNFEVLIDNYPKLQPFVFKNKYGNLTINFSDAKAVRTLNTAILKADYGINYWQFDDNNLTPPIPSRVAYIHLLKDLLLSSNLDGNIKVLDIGTGANCIYPLLGQSIYNWQFVGSDVNRSSIKQAEKIIAKNQLEDEVSVRFQSNPNQIFQGILTKTDTFTLTMCNPPFYKDETEANSATLKKLKGLNQDTNSINRNFSGISNELWYKGGEKAFLHNYLYESSLFKNKCFWYTTLVANKDNIKSMYASLDKLGAKIIKTLPINIGQKKSRVVAWTFLNKDQQKQWNK